MPDMPVIFGMGLGFGFRVRVGGGALDLEELVDGGDGEEEEEGFELR
jgi:hypothetical protein